MVEHRHQVIEELRQLSSPDFKGEDCPGVPGMREQVLLTPELPGDFEVLAVAEKESCYVVGCRAPAVEEPESPAQRIIFPLPPGPRDQALVSIGCGQAGKGQRRAMPSAQPVGSLRYCLAELPDECHVVVTGQPLAGCP
jgi:hypothetical protein